MNNSNLITNKKLNSKKNKNVKNIKMEEKIIKPFIKWVGGKTQIINHIIEQIPKEFENYYEPFIGGGSVLLAVLSLYKQNKIKINGNIYAYDLNPILINLYQNIKNNKDDLYERIQKYIKVYTNIKNNSVNKKSDRKTTTLDEAIKSKESYYYWLRDQFNKENKKEEKDKDLVKCSALFMFINKTCFRGVYREGPNGFNVPYGHYKTTPNIITKDELDNISELIKDVEFKCADFSSSFENIKKGDFVYLDPPYAPKNSKSFVGYTKDGFGIEQHKLLFNLTDELNSKSVKIMMSNAKVKLVTDHFGKKNKNYNIKPIKCRRAINSKNPGATAMEVIITNKF